MTEPGTRQPLSEPEAGLWAAVERLWALAAQRDLAAIAAAVHPDYTGWVTGEDRPHDRSAALASVGPEAPATLDYALTPLTVRLAGEATGIVHYAYTATVAAGDGTAKVAGRWTEVYLRDCRGWRLAAVSGGPDGRR